MPINLLQKLFNYYQLDTNVFCVDKPLGISSYAVVEAFKQLTNFYRVGHAGTLDPLATGALLILVNNATKRTQEFLGMDKVYKFFVLFGIETESADLETPAVNIKEVELDKDTINSILHKLKGKHSWEVKGFSALKVKGKAMYKYKHTLQVRTKTMEIYEINFLSMQNILIEELEDKLVQKMHTINQAYQNFAKTGVKLSSKHLTLHQNLLSNFENLISSIKNAGVKNFYLANFSVKVSAGTYIRVIVQQMAKLLNLPATTFAIYRECSYNNGNQK